MSRNIWNRLLGGSMVGTGIFPNNIWGPPLPKVTRHSGWLPYTVTPSIDQTLHQFLTVTDLDLITKFDFLPNCARFPQIICNGCGMPTEDAYSSGHLVLSHFGTSCVLMSRPISSEPALFADFWVSNIPRYFSAWKRHRSSKKEYY